MAEGEEADEILGYYGFGLSGECCCVIAGVILCETSVVVCRCAMCVRAEW
jgi:hypothetical protein